MSSLCMNTNYVTCYHSIVLFFCYFDFYWFAHNFVRLFFQLKMFKVAIIALIVAFAQAQTIVELAQKTPSLSTLVPKFIFFRILYFLSRSVSSPIPPTNLSLMPSLALGPSLCLLPPMKLSSVLTSTSRMSASSLRFSFSIFSLLCYCFSTGPHLPRYWCCHQEHWSQGGH